MSRPALGLAVAAVLTFSGAAAARDLYVNAQTGVDGAAGDRRAPLRSLTQAAERLRPGDVLHIAGGVYREPLVLARSGAPDAPIVVRGEGRPLIETPGEAVNITGSYIRVEGLEVHALDWGSAVAVGKHNHHVTINDNILRDSGCGGVSAQYTDYLTVTRNTAFGNARRAPWQCSGLSLYHPEAFDRRKGLHNLFADNVSFDNQNVFVDDAVSHSGGMTTDGNGIIIDDADHTQADTSDPPYEGMTLITNNLVFGNGGRGVHVFHSSNVVIVRNVAYLNLKDPLLQQRPAGEISVMFSRRVSVVDNIAVARPGEYPLFDGYGPDAGLWRGNIYQSDLPPRVEHARTEIGPDNRRRDPGFIRPRSEPGGDFALRPDSPARRAGAAYRLVDDAAPELTAGASDVGLIAGRPIGARQVVPTGRSVAP